MKSSIQRGHVGLLLLLGQPSQACRELPIMVISASRAEQTEFAVPVPGKSFRPAAGYRFE